MIRLKTQKEIDILSEGGYKLSQILSTLKSQVKSGMFTNELEDMALKLFQEANAKPAFLGYKTHGKKYPAALCISINENIVHCPGTLKRKIKEGDIVSIDIGMIYQGLYTDMATTVAVGDVPDRTKLLLSITKKSLEEGIKQAILGGYILDIGKKIEGIAKGAGLGVVRELVGHGVGYEVHEDPVVPNFYDGSIKNIKLEEGLVIAIEPMLTLGGEDIELADDGWAYKTIDNSLSAHFEATIAITKEGTKIITPIV